MIQADTSRLGELTRYLLKSEDAVLWLSVIANQHMLPNGVSVGKAVLTQFLVQLMEAKSDNFDTDKVEVFTKNDCALWFSLFPVLKVVYLAFATEFIKKLLTLGEKYENKDSVRK